MSKSPIHEASFKMQGFQLGIAVSALFLVPLPALIMLISFGQPELHKPIYESNGIAPAVLAEPIVTGQSVYTNTCTVCHQSDGAGIVGLGKPLRNSAFVQDSSDEVLHSLIATGRSIDDPMNTTGVMMPARGAQNISDEEIDLVVAYLREMQDPSQPHASVEAWDKENTADSDAGAEPDENTAVANAMPGRELFVSMCSACHGADANGLEGLGKSLSGSNWIAAHSDKEVMTMVKMGRPIWDAENTTGVDMPSKGGNPAMNDEQLGHILDYLRAISTVSVDEGS